MGFPSDGRLGWTGRQRSVREPALREPPPVEAPILNGLAHMLRLEVRSSLEVSDGAGDLENPVIGPRRQREPRDRRAQQRVGAVRYATERADVARGRSTRSRTASLGSPPPWSVSARYFTAGTSRWMSMRSSKGPETRAR